MKNILLPTDFSNNSRNAIHYAFQFFKDQECEFYFLNVQKISEYLTGDIYAASKDNSVFDAVIQDNKQKLQNFIDELEKEYGSETSTIHPIVDYDVFTDAVNQVVDKNKIDIIIMGSNGATGAKEVIFGSNTLSVIRKVDCPLLIIPEKYSFKKINSALFTIHNQEIIDSNKLTPLLEILLKYNCTLKILEINEKNKESENNQEEIKELFTEVITEYYSLVDLPAPVAVSAFVQLIDVQIHATFTERETIFERFIFGSETAKISYETKIPLLILQG